MLVGTTLPHSLHHNLVPSTFAAAAAATCRHLSCLVDLQHLDLSGWMTVTKSIVHLHGLHRLTHLSLGVADMFKDHPDPWTVHVQIREAAQLVAAVWGGLIRRAALVQLRQKKDAPPQKQQQEEAWHDNVQASAGASTTSGLRAAARNHAALLNLPEKHLRRLTLIWPAVAGYNDEDDGFPGPAVGWIDAAAAMGGALTCLELTGPVCQSAQVGKERVCMPMETCAVCNTLLSYAACGRDAARCIMSKCMVVWQHTADLCIRPCNHGLTE
jgi:hypothetical protein